MTLSINHNNDCRAPTSSVGSAKKYTHFNIKKELWYNFPMVL